MAIEGLRQGEIALDIGPGDQVDASLRFIGRLRTPWRKCNCPHNLREARERGGKFNAVIDPEYRAGLAGLTPGQAVILLYWMDAARRDLIVQAPSHRSQPAGTFALRSPARPNPISLAVTRLVAIDAASGVLEIDALDAFDGTPLLDIKPWLETVDTPMDADTEGGIADRKRPSGAGMCGR